MIGTISIEVNAKNPNMPLWPLRAYVNSPSSLRLVNVPRKIGSWCISAVRLVVVYPDGGVQAAQCVQTGGVWVGTVEGTATSGTCENGYTVFADGTDENGNSVTGYILGKGDVEILHADGTPSPDPARYSVKLLSAEAEQPIEGDMWPTDGGYVIWQNGQANLLGTPFEQISAYVESAVSAKVDLSAIHGDYIEDADGNKIGADRIVEKEVICPWIMSNGAGTQYTFVWNTETQLWEVGNLRIGFIEGVWKYGIKAGAIINWINTQESPEDTLTLTFPVMSGSREAVSKKEVVGTLAIESDLSSKADLSAIPTKTSDLSNDSGYITSAEIEPYYSYESSEQLNTGLANKAMYLGTIDESREYDDSGYLNATVKFQSQNVDPYISLNGNYFGFWPWTLTQFFGTTYSPALELVWWKGPFFRLRAGRYSQVYNGFMWRTKGVGFAIPCSEDGIPDGRLFEITKVEETSPYSISNSGSENHTITGNENWTSIETIDGQTNQIVCTRAITLKNKGYVTSFAAKDDLPTKTSDLSNDSGFITSADLSAKADLSVLDNYIHDGEDTAVIHNLTCDELVANSAWLPGYATSSDLSAKADLSALSAYREKSDLYYEHSFSKTNWQNVPRFIMNYDGTQTIFDKFDSTLNRWNVSTGTSDWYVQESLVGMEADPQFTLMRLDMGIESIQPTEGAGTTTVEFIHAGVEGMFTMDMSDELVLKLYVDRQLTALEARIAALEGN